MADENTEGEVQEATRPAATADQTVVVEPMNEPSETNVDRVREGRAMVPADATGAKPTDMAGMVTYAQGIARAVGMLPEHLRNNVGDCFAMIDMANKCGLSPVMLMRESYKVGNQIGFSSHAWHALLEGSGLLLGALHYDWSGEGDQLTCTVTGTLKNDPREKVYTSPTLAQLHPGHVEKTVEGQKIRKVRGSQLWDRKPRIQIAYDARRDWVRLFCPRAVLGIYTVDELEDSQLGPAAFDTPADRVRTGLSSAKIVGGEGYRDGYAERELTGETEPAQPPVQEDRRTAQRRERAPAAARRQAARKPKPAARTAKPQKGKRAPAAAAAPQRTTTLERRQAPSKKAVKAAADRAEERSKQQAAGKPAARVMPTGKPGPAAEKAIQDTLAWIASGVNAERLNERWDAERELRDQAEVPIAKRSELRATLDAKISSLERAGKK